MTIFMIVGRMHDPYVHRTWAVKAFKQKESAEQLLHQLNHWLTFSKEHYNQVLKYLLDKIPKENLSDKSKTIATIKRETAVTLTNDFDKQFKLAHDGDINNYSYFMIEVEYDPD